VKISNATFVFFFAFAAFSGSAIAQPEGAGAPLIISHKTNPHEGEALTAGSTGVITPPITYHNGPVLGTPHVFLIWYGNWNQTNGSDTPAGQTIVRDFLFGLNNSPYYQINHSYGTPTGSVNLSSLEYTDNYSHGSRLSDSAIQTIVSGAIASGKLGTADTTGLYFVLTSSDVSERSGFCSKYCGWHTAGTISGTNIKYSFVGNAHRCLSACAAQTVGPNGNAGVDGMVSVIAHELEETNTDPNPISGWADSNGAENGDKCAWTFGANPQGPVNAQYNMTLPTASGGSRNYLVQRNLDASSKCYVNYVTKTQ
jgi:Phosphate-induced protein 1 conserved region